MPATRMTTTCDSAWTALFLTDCCASRHKPGTVIARGAVRGVPDVEVVGDGTDGGVIRYDEDVGEAVGAIAAGGCLQRVGRAGPYHPCDKHVIPLPRDGYDTKRVRVEHHAADHKRAPGVHERGARVCDHEFIHLQHPTFDDELATADLQGGIGCRIGDNQAATVQLNEVVTGGRGESNEKVRGEHRAAVNHDRITSLQIANSDDAGLPNAAIDHTHTIAQAAHIDRGADHFSVIGNNQAVVRAAVPDGQATKGAPVVPERTGAGDHHTVVAARLSLTHRASEYATADYLGTVADHQTVARSEVADVHKAIVAPDRAGTGAGYAIVTASETEAHRASGVRYVAGVTDGQGITRTLVTDVQVQAGNTQGRWVAAPGRVGVSNHHAVVAAADLVAEIAERVGQHTAAVDQQHVTIGVGADNVTA